MCRSHASEWLITTQGPLPCTVQFSSMPLLLTFIVFFSSRCRASTPVGHLRPHVRKLKYYPAMTIDSAGPARPDQSSLVMPFTRAMRTTSWTCRSARIIVDGFTGAHLGPVDRFVAYMLRPV